MIKINTLYFRSSAFFERNRNTNAIFVRNGSQGCGRLCEGTSSLQRGVCTPGSALHFLAVPACVLWPTLMGANEGHVSINLGSVVYCQIEEVEQHKGT